MAGPALKKIRKKWRQSGKGLGGNLAKLGIEMGSRALNSSIGKRLINKGIDNIPDIFKYGVSKINKNLKRYKKELCKVPKNKIQKIFYHMI